MQLVTRINEVRTSTRKVRIVADSIRGLSVGEAQDALSVIEKRGARDLGKALNSAIANAVNNNNLEKSNLVIRTIDVNEGAFLKRYRPSTRGRIHPYKKRTSNIRIVLEEKFAQQPKVETKALPAKTDEKVETKGKEKSSEAKASKDKK